MRRASRSRRRRRSNAPPTSSKRQSRAWRWLGAAAALYLASVLAIWALLYFAGDRWWFATVLLFGPRWVAALPALVLLPLALWKYRRAAALVATAALVVAWPIMGFNIVLTKPMADSSVDLRVLTYNVGGELGQTPPSLENLRRLIDIARPHIIALQECNFNADELGANFPQYQQSLQHGTCFLSRLTILREDLRDRADIVTMHGSGAIDRYEVATSRARFSVQNVHLATVREGLQAVRGRVAGSSWVMRYNIAERRLESSLAREWTQRSKLPQLVMGDFNLPDDSVIFRHFWGDYGDANLQCGGGYGYTKFTDWFGIRIDHVLFDSRWECIDAQVGESLGGDHRPLIVDLRLR